MRTIMIQKDQWQTRLELDHVKVINYALFHAGIPILRQVRLVNEGSESTPGLKISLAIQGYSKSWTKDIPPVQPGSEFALEKVDLKLDYTKLEGKESSTQAELILALNGEICYTETIRVLGSYEWPTGALPAFQKSIACFVPPAHPVIQRIILTANNYLKEDCGHESFRTLRLSKRPERVMLALKAIYNCISSNYNIIYDDAPVYSYETSSQSIRPPHRVIDDLSLSTNGCGYGVGTCIDLSLLFAACLEHVSLKPVMIFVRTSRNRLHAFVGCWQNKPGKSFDLFIQYNDLRTALINNNMICIETTGLTGEHQLDFEAAIEAGNKHLVDVASCEQEKKKANFAFALDITAARENKLFPLQFAMSPGAISTIREAEALALRGSSLTLEPKHLLFSLFLCDIENNPPVFEALQAAGGDVRTIRKKINTMLEYYPAAYHRSNTALLKPTMDYLYLIEQAKIMAQMAGQLMDRSHLCLSICRSPHKDIERILGTIGLKQGTIIEKCEAYFLWVGRIGETRYPGSKKSHIPENEQQVLLKALDLESLTFDLDLSPPGGSTTTSFEHDTDPDKKHSQKGSAKELILKGSDLLVSRLYEKALVCFERALSQDPENTVGGDGKGYCLLGLGLWTDADALFDQVLSRDPINLCALAGKGISLFKQGFAEAGNEFFARALAVHPRIPALWSHQAAFYVRQKDFNSALQCFYQALGLLVSQKRKHETSLVVEKALQFFPADIRLQQFQGWIIRLDGPGEADLVKSGEKLEALYRDMRESDPETMGLLAGTYKRLWRFDPIKYNHLLQESFNLYHQAWIASEKKNLYVGINVATMALILDNPLLSRATASQILEFYQPEDLTNLPEVGPEFSVYWYRAIQAEAELLLGHLGRAGRMYADLMELHIEKSTYIESSLAQIDLILPRLGLSIDAVEFVNKFKAYPGARRLRLGIIGFLEDPFSRDLDTKVKQVLDVISPMLPDKITWEVATDPVGESEKMASKVILSEKQAFLSVVHVHKSGSHQERGDKKKFQNILDEAEEIVFLPADKDNSKGVSPVHQYILAHSDILLILTDNQKTLKTGGIEIVFNIARTKKIPLISIKAENGYTTTYENLEQVAKADCLKGDYLMYDPKPIDTTRIEFSEDMKDLMELLAQNAHEVWARQRMDEGWTYGPERDDYNKKNPCLVPYAELPPSEKEYDRRMAMETVKAITALGYRIEKEGADHESR